MRASCGRACSERYSSSPLTRTMCLPLPGPSLPAITRRWEAGAVNVSRGVGGGMARGGGFFGSGSSGGGRGLGSFGDRRGGGGGVNTPPQVANLPYKAEIEKSLDDWSLTRKAYRLKPVL